MKLWFEGWNVNARERIGDQPAPAPVARFAIIMLRSRRGGQTVPPNDFNAE
jgi:hypothetical protein